MPSATRTLAQYWRRNLNGLSQADGSDSKSRCPRYKWSEKEVPAGSMRAGEASTTKFPRKDPVARMKKMVTRILAMSKLKGEETFQKDRRNQNLTNLIQKSKFCLIFYKQ